MQTAAAKLREARENGHDYVDIRDGRQFRVFVLADASRDDVQHRPSKIDTAIARAELDERGLMRAEVEQSEGSNVPEALRNPFMHVVSAGGADGGGLTAHRGVLQGHEYVDAAALRAAVEDELGYTYDQIRSVYRQGPVTGAKRELRDVIDARMLALRRSGANMVELGRAIGLAVNASGNCRALDNAVSRARAVEQWKANLS